MAQSIGSRIGELRRARGITQGGLAETLGVSAQAVSKWETDAACPDITLLPKLAEELHTSVDALLSESAVPETRFVPEEQRRDIDDLVFKIRVQDGGDKVRVNLPMPLMRAFLDMGMHLGDGDLGIGGKTESLRNVDLSKLLTLVEKGAVGKLVEVESEDGAYVEIFVE